MARTMSQAFNEWMRRYIENPEEFSREFQAAIQFQSEREQVAEPSYGTDCTIYLQSLMNEETI